MQVGDLQTLQGAGNQNIEADAKAQAYVLANVVAARDGRKCVDGRYLPTQASGMLARPGGDCGYVMALLAVNKRKKLGLTPEQCFNAVYKAVSKSDYGHFCMHTDHHADPDSHTHVGLIGCGHVAKAAAEELSAEYDVEAPDVKRVVEYARNIADILPTLELVNLEGEHEEAGVLVVYSKDYTVNSDDPMTKRMYFVYDEERDNEFLKYLVFEMKMAGVSYDELKVESDLQIKATLHNLAKGLPIYNVKFENNSPVVEFASIVE